MSAAEAGGRLGDERLRARRALRLLGVRGLPRRLRVVGRLRMLLRRVLRMAAERLLRGLGVLGVLRGRLNRAWAMAERGRRPRDRLRARAGRRRRLRGLRGLRGWR
ncbi:MAG: hypothetical protein JWP97_4703, partial [Labilithrix sp.]|nr:hypothetical protein [Labilithrix sp.]